MMHMMGLGLFFGFLWFVFLVAALISWFVLVFAVWRIMKTNEKMLDAVSHLANALRVQPTTDAHEEPAEPAEVAEEKAVEASEDLPEN